MNKTYAGIISFSFWKAFWITMRPYLIFISGTSGLVGMAFIEDPKIVRVVIAFIPFFFSYGLGQALTDCFQMDTDAISSPYRPLIKGTISRKQVLSVSLTGLGLGVFLLGYLNPIILFFSVLAVIGLLTYTWFKRTWLGGPPWNAWIVALLPIMGRLTDREYHLKTIFNLDNSYSTAFLFSILAIFFGYANFVIMGYFKDISADKKTSYQTFPVRFGWKPAAIYSDVVALLSAACTGLALWALGIFRIFGVSIFVVAVGLNLYAQIKIHQTRDESKTHGPITNVVRSFLLYCIAIVVSLKPIWIFPIAVLYILFELALISRPEKSQV